jgi:hypothetical protein
MSMDSREQLSMPARWKLLICVIAAMFAVGLSSQGTVRAQDASPEASPAAECGAPELPPGTPTPQEEASPAAMEGMDMATPVVEEATEEATEEASPEAEDAGTPAEGDEAAAITAAAYNVIACVNSGNYEGAAALLSDIAMMSEFGTTNPYDVVVNLDGFSFGDATVDNPRTYEDGHVSADVSYMGSQYQIIKERWNLVQDGEYWKIDSFETLTADYEGDSATLGVNLTETENDDGTKTYAFEIAGNTDPTVVPTVAELDALVLHGNNTGSETHEIAVVQLPEGADPAGILDGSISENDITFIGQITLPPGEQGDMVLQGLPAGIYTMVCFFEAPDGVPHAARGMIAQFEVTAPTS